MLNLQPDPDGTILPVRAQPGARRNEIRGEQDGMLKVCVTQSPEKGKANKALIELLSKDARAAEVADRTARRRDIAHEAILTAGDYAGRVGGADRAARRVIATYSKSHMDEDQRGRRRLWLLAVVSTAIAIVVAIIPISEQCSLCIIE